MESYIIITFLNDFLFCPRSIYFHELLGKLDKRFYDDAPQIEGRAAHSAIDEGRYSSKKAILQGLEVYSDVYGLCGKIDILDTDMHTLIERKRLIKHVYDGYVFQLYAQYHALTEMGYRVERLVLRSMSDNKSYPVPLPSEAPDKQAEFEQLIDTMRTYDLSAPFTPVAAKCQRCNYRDLCDYSLAPDMT